MRKILILVAAILLLSVLTPAQVKVRIIVHTILPGDSLSVFIAGSNPQLGNWNPGAVSLNKTDESTWSKTFSFPKDQSIEYKFTLGEWSKEGFEKENITQGNYNLSVKNDTIIEYNIAYWGKSNGFKGQITGKAEYYRNFKGKSISERDIIVWLPSEYSDTTKKFPVIYAHDGQNLVDPATSATGIDWQIDETIDSLVKQNKITPEIVVGIYNTRSRMVEYSYSDSGYAYMDFIVNELKPFIDNKYRTLTDRENTATVGSSLGGLISFMLLWEHTDVFSKAACLSPAFKVGRFNYLPYIENYAGPKKEFKLYIDNGGIGIDKEIQPGVDETVSLLEKKGYQQGTDFIVFYDKNASHNEAAWAKRIWRPLTFFFGK